MMKIQPLKYSPNVSFGVQDKNDSIYGYKKKKILVYAGTATAIAGLVMLANYTRGRVKRSGRISELQRKKNEFLELCKSATSENYVVSPENLKNGVFRFDLHSHSNHSDGRSSVPELLSQVAQYADELFAKTGKKFTFSLTDHDRISGVEEALSIIKKNPEKYKNVNFVPGVELSFSYNSAGQVKAGELLAYFINPESKSIRALLKNLDANRKNIFAAGIKKLGSQFSEKEMFNYFINKDYETFAYHLHYRLRNYAQIKNRVIKMAKEQSRDSSELYKELMNAYVFPNGKRAVQKPFVSPEGFDKFLKRAGINTQTPMIDERINTICDEFFPKIVEGRVVSSAENSFEKIIDTVKYDDGVVLGFAHPYFTAEKMVDFRTELGKMIDYAGGKLQLTEKYHQAYHPKIDRNKINEVNEFLSIKGLISIGGRDNHQAKFLSL